MHLKCSFGRWAEYNNMAKRITLGKLKAKVQVVFNKYIRLRDSGGGFFTCISCGMTKSTDQLNAGHFYAVKGYDGLRFDELNVQSECASCNCWDESHLIGYAINLNTKIGESELSMLHERARKYKQNSGFKWDRAELESMLIEYKEKIKEVQ
jgi:hypothetical protein